MSMLQIEFRKRFLLGTAACTAMLAYALYSQYVGGLMPCPLCTFQRGAYALLGLVFLLGGVHAPRRAWMRIGYIMLTLLAAALGAAIAVRHVWLQHLPPDRVPSCGPDLAYMLEAFPLADVVRKVLTGSGECAKVDWTFLGLAMPAWSLIGFCALAIWAAFGLRRVR